MKIRAWNWPRAGAILMMLLVLLAPASLHAEGSCLAVERLKVNERTGDTCRFAGAILNRCGREVRYAIVRAVPHPERGPLPTVTGAIGRFQLAPLSFDREICQQGHHVLEVAGDGALRDVTGEAIKPELTSEPIAATAERINACVRTCAPADLDRAGILGELRTRHGGAVDAPEVAPAIDDIIAVTLAERQAKDQLCAAVCQGRLAADAALIETAHIDHEATQHRAGPLSLLAALAARPARAPQQEAEAVLPERDEGPPPPRKWRKKGRHAAAASGNRSTRCRSGSNGRCRLVLDLAPRAHARPSGKTQR